MGDFKNHLMSRPEAKMEVLRSPPTVTADVRLCFQVKTLDPEEKIVFDMANFCADSARR